MVAGLFKYALRIALGILAVVAILTLSLNFYLGLSGTQARLRTLATGALGTPVLWKGMEHINILRGTTILDFRIPGEGGLAPEVRDPGPTPSQPPIHPPLLEAPRVEVAYSPLDLLDGRVVLPKLSFDHPVLALPEDAEGRLILPLHTPRQATPAPASSGTEKENTPEPAAAPQPWPLTLSSLSITGGRLRILDREGRDAVLLDGIEHGGRISRGGNGDQEPRQDSLNAFGQFSATALRFGKFTSANLQGGYTFSQATISLTKLLGTAYHGQWTGKLVLKTDAPGLPCDFEFQSTGIELSEILKSAGRPDLLSGSLSLTLSGRGPSRELSQVAASAGFTIRDGQLIRVGFVEDLATALNLKDLSQPDFTDCHGTLTLSEGRLLLSDFSLAAAAWTLTGAGAAGLDGTLALDCRLHFHPETVARLPAAVAAKLTKEENGDAFVPFTLRGRLDNPESDLLTRLGLPKAKPAAAAPATAGSPIPTPTP
ncbi:AsmA-like C-terminal region-containing protein [Verrucomicrobium sp. GAS474]|uniref:AsmA-like C-terminal region-containing protein n=1 Tax=Verrucomicrobium sp. GAS474 TaxID=1882831 RepID=UPI000B80965C|nr:AsmA-like C-terminal region-containing protein [Verrucomicrobium sp. GAS474]